MTLNLSDWFLANKPLVFELSFRRRLTIKEWSEVLKTISRRQKFYKFITELQDAVDTSLPFKSILVHLPMWFWSIFRHMLSDSCIEIYSTGF